MYFQRDRYWAPSTCLVVTSLMVSPLFARRQIKHLHLPEFLKGVQKNKLLETLPFTCTFCGEAFETKIRHYLHTVCCPKNKRTQENMRQREIIHQRTPMALGLSSLELLVSQQLNIFFFFSFITYVGWMRARSINLWHSLRLNAEVAGTAKKSFWLFCKYLR